MIKQVTQTELDALIYLANQIWINHSRDDLFKEYTDIIHRNDACIFLKYDQDIAIGFAQCQLRHDYVEGTKSSPVGYLEGIFIEEQYRHYGHATELLASCEHWAKEMGCQEFASDCELDNQLSLDFHLNVGFNEVNRIICFKKTL